MIRSRLPGWIGPCMKETTREWVRKAEADYVAARRLRRGSDPLHDVVCFQEGNGQVTKIGWWYFNVHT